MLTIEALSVRIGRVPVVRQVSGQVGAGECRALLGRNGAGKTSLVRGLAGLLPATGRILLDGARFDRLPAAERARLIGYVAQESGGGARALTTLDMLLLAQNGGRMGWRVAPEHLHAAEATLERLGLASLAHRPLGAMSGGQRQMVALAAALVRRPRLLLLDEPTSALDLANQLRMLEAVRAYTREAGAATLMVLHDLNLATRFADSVMLLQDGQAVGEGPVEAMLTEQGLARTFGVACRILPVDGALRAIYPLAVS